MSPFQSLENRLLFAITAALDNGVLTITGTNAADFVYATSQAGKLTLLEGGVNRGQFEFDEVNRINVSLGDGNDQYSVGFLNAIRMRIEGGDGADNLSGGYGRDTIRGGDGDDACNGSAGNDLVDGGADNDGVGGGIGNDSLRGGDGRDLMTGGPDDDTLDGGAGNDRFRGSSGRDIVTYASRTANVTADIDGTSDELPDDGEAGEEDFIETDCEILIGGAGNDSLTGTTTNDANDPDVDYANLIIGNGGNDTLNGLDANDTLDGGLGDDVFNGGAGRDVADYFSRTERLNLSIDNNDNDGAAGEADDIRSDIETIYGGSGNDRIIGSNRANQLRGNAGNDTIDGGPGKDLLIGNGGADTVSYASRSNPVIVTLDDERNDGEDGELDLVREIERITGGSANDRLTGDNNANIIKGGDGNDTLTGNAGNDRLYGDDGNDRLTGGAGLDRFFGGAGNDRLFAQDNRNDILDGGEDSDTALVDDEIDLDIVDVEDVIT